VTQPAIIYVPGIKPKPPAAAHRAALWRCLLEGVRRADAEVAADMARHPGCFSLVSWAHIFYDSQRDLALDEPGIERLLAMPGPDLQDLREAASPGRQLKRWLYRLSDRFPPLFDLVGDPNMRATLRDTRRYFSNEGGAAVRVRQLVADALLEAWHADRRVLLIGHSLGSVIAFDVLWELSHRFAVTGRLDLFISLGSPLGLSFVRDRLLGAREKGRRRYPTNIRRWQNLAAIGEMTALDRRLADDFAEMRALGLVEEISDRLDLQTYYRGPEGLNVHKCYGYMVNRVFGAAVASWWREGAPGAMQPGPAAHTTQSERGIG
jgi:hypothetical protein